MTIHLLKGQCNPDLMIAPSNTCPTAPLICALDGYCSETNGDVQNTVSFCGNAGLQGPSWFKFIATSDNISFNLKVKSCSSGQGVQIALYLNCNDLVNGAIYCRTAPVTVGNTITVNATATAGKLVYLVLDGQNGSVCEFEVHTISGIDQPDIAENSSSVLTGPSEFCLGEQELIYELQNVGVAVSYIWDIPNSNQIITSDSVLKIKWQNALPSGSKICVKGVNGCDTTNTYCLDLNLANPVIVDAGIDQIIPCDSSIVLGGTSGVGNNLQYIWTKAGDPTVLSTSKNYSTDIDGIYILKATDSLGCSTFDSVKLTAAPLITGLKLDKSIFCFNDPQVITVEAVFGGSNPFLYAFNESSYTTNNEFILLQNPDTISVIDSYHCKYDTILTFVKLDSFWVDAGQPMITVEEGYPIDLLGITSLDKSQIITQIWKKGDTILCTNCSTLNTLINSSGYYSYEVTDINGCTSADSIFIRFELADRSIFIPNAFSPNFDGINDVFTIQGARGIKKINSMRIYNRWGICVYEGKNLEINNINQGWDGKMKGKYAEHGVYVYLIEVEMIDQKTKIIKGDVSLMK